MSQRKHTRSLAEFQQWMQHQLMDPYGQTGATAPVESVICESERLSAHEHLAIYQRSYIARLRDCMTQQFSALEHALGPELFEGFADEYLSVYPSRNYNLMPLGAHFADFLEATRPDRDAPEGEREDWPDFMIELARFEFAINQIFAERSDEEYTLATEDSLDEDLRLLPVFHLFAHQFPVRWYYSAVVNGDNPPLPYAQESYCVVLRHQYRLSLYDLPPAQYHLLYYMQQGYTLAEAREYLVAAHELDVRQVDLTWPTWKARMVAACFFRKV